MRTKDSSVQCAFIPILSDLLFFLDRKVQNQWGDDAQIVITSGSEQSAKHSFTSLHYDNKAADIRSHETFGRPDRQIQFNLYRSWIAEFCSKRRIAVNWIDFVMEKTHFHIEYQPKSLFA